MDGDKSPSSHPTAIPPYDVAAFARAASPASERAMRVLARLPSLPPVFEVDEADYEKLYAAIKGLR